MAKQTRKTLKKTTQIPEIPIRVTVDVVIRHEYVHPIDALKTRGHQIKSLTADGDCPGNRFSYSFEKENASVLSLSVEEFEKDNPGDSGDFTTCINDASPEPKVRVIVLAKEDLPGGRASLSLKFLGKDVFTPAKELTPAGGGFLKLNTLVKLPL